MTIHGDSPHIPFQTGKERWGGWWWSFNDTIGKKYEPIRVCAARFCFPTEQDALQDFRDWKRGALPAANRKVVINGRITDFSTRKVR